MRNLTSIALIASLLLLVAATDAWSIPAFSRKYQTSCHTCHTAFPKLNPFGNAFRLRGYRMPAETEDMVKEEPVPLGQPAYKRVWPDAIWPSDIPGTAPIAVDVRMASHTQHDAETDETLKNDLRFPESIGLLGAGTLGETISFLAGIEFEIEPDEHGSTVETSIGHASLHFNGPWGTGPAFNVKVGRFSPELAQSFNHGYLLSESPPANMFAFNPIAAHGGSEVGAGGHQHGGGAGGIAVPASVDGLEAYGVVGRRFDYSFGIGNGMGPGEGSFDGNSAKDFYGRVGYKLGGMSLDGSEYEEEKKNWRENSIRFGLFGYRGDGEGMLFQQAGHHADEFLENRDFSRLGVDANIYVRDLNVILGFVRGRDTLGEFVAHEDDHGDDNGDDHGDDNGDDHGATPELEFEGEEEFTYKAWFAEADYVFMPWLHAGVRYEWLDPANERRDEFQRLTANFTALIRANLKASLELQRDLGGQNEDDYQLRGGVRFAF